MKRNKEIEQAINLGKAYGLCPKIMYKFAAGVIRRKEMYYHTENTLVYLLLDAANHPDWYNRACAEAWQRGIFKKVWGCRYMDSSPVNSYTKLVGTYLANKRDEANLGKRRRVVPKKVIA